jgi:hypothetical protein
MADEEEARKGNLDVYRRWAERACSWLGSPPFPVAAALALS